MFTLYCIVIKNKIRSVLILEYQFVDKTLVQSLWKNTIMMYADNFMKKTIIA